ncbi:SMI1/KNR4 family protein [Neomegalonema perideroedes]|uniref:SMI1/KNR4 family protein n=1 Tax=Neomegalonema perideroedes TaxID=217219 RepID=UPI000360C21E|nr:SMI1/KNR4 family protein [Neomegalonema perideroedes]
MNWLDELEKIAPPPAAERRGPVPSPEDWAAAEQALGLRIPGDYKAFVARYGSDGAFAEEFSCYSPVSAYQALSLPRATEGQAWAYSEMQSSSPRRFPMPLFPAPGGFFAIGVSGNGDYFGWIVGAGAPETWRAAWLGDEEGEADVYDMSLTQWLVAFVQGRIRGKAMWVPPPEDLPMRFFGPRT